MRNNRIKRIPVLVLVLVVGAMAPFAGCSKKDASGGVKMGMNMGPGGSGSKRAPAETEAPEKKVEQKPVYQCPMHPSYTSDRPGQCPICGMTLVKVEQNPPAKSVDEEAVADMPPGLAMVTIPGAKRQLIGIRAVEAKRETLVKTVRASATVKPDERRVKQVQSKVQGWVERLYVNFTGQYVKRGKAMMAIYSPDLVSTQEEYLLALKNLDMLKDSEPFIKEGAEELAAAAKRRLRYWDISNSQIRRLARTGKTFKNMTLYSPIKGYVLHINAIEGMEVKLGMPLYTIADLSRVWVMADVHERDIGQVELGMTGTLLADAYPGSSFDGKVTYINPDLDPKTRTVWVRIELPNQDLKLKPDMHGDVIIKSEIADALVVPPSAVMDNGDVKVVFVDVGDGQYMPRKVKVGVRTSQQAQILEGLKEGERVVVDGNFLIDSESRLRASIPGTGGHHH